MDENGDCAIFAQRGVVSKEDLHCDTISTFLSVNSYMLLLRIIYLNFVGDRLGCTSVIEHKIVTGSPPIKQKYYYRVSPMIQKHIGKMLKSRVL